MELSILLGQITGVYMLIVGISFLARQKMWHDVISDLAQSRLVMTVLGLGEMLIGLIVIILHNEWGQTWQALVTLIGWLMVIEGGSYLLLPKSLLKKSLRKSNVPAFFVVAGIAAILLGGYLIYVSFGLGV